MRRAGSDLRTDSGFDTREADGVRSHAELLLQMMNVLHHRQYFEAPVVESEQHADAYIVNARFHGPVKRRSAPVIVALGAFQVDRCIGAAMISLLEKLEGPNLSFFELPKAFRRLRGKIHVHAPDFAGPDTRAVDGRDGVENVLKALFRQRFS